MTGNRHAPGPAGLAVAAQVAGVRDQRVLEAIRSTPREAFVPARYASMAYADQPVPISHGQVTSQPSLIAAMVAALDLTGTEKVLEVGTGYGYQTALLARLAAQVISIDVWPDMVAQARENLAGQGIGNAVLITGDGSQGVPEHAPFGAIIVSAAFPKVPPPLADQLADGGRLVQPVGPGGGEDVIVYRKSGSGLTCGRVLTMASFVRLHGRYGYPPPPQPPGSATPRNR
jgi:protein-L-isoaspartate(D-aspartate) O-methyltransferase